MLSLIFILLLSCAKDKNGGQKDTVTDVDGNTYKTVIIGDQVWMGENLKAVHYADGEAIPCVESNKAWDTLSAQQKVYCYYDNNDENENIYGALYTWAAATNDQNSPDSPSGIQGVCPDGWHMPSDEEWKQLEIYLGMTRSEADRTGDRGIDEGGKLKEIFTAHWESPNLGATNMSGFTALPGGIRVRIGEFTGLSNTCGFWTTTESGNFNAYARRLHSDNATIHRSMYDKTYGYSVRCVKDSPYVE